MCGLEFPDLETRIWQRFADRGVVVLGLAGNGLFGAESATTVAAFRDATGVTFPLLLGDATYLEYAASDDAISPYPLDVIVDRDGIVRYLRREFDPETMAATIEQLLVP